MHSLKDLPTAPAEDLEIIAIPTREDSRDVLVGCRLDDLADGMRIGTGAPRREMQILDWAVGRNLKLDVVPIRGNVETRIERAREGMVDAVILAAAGLRRLGVLGEPATTTGDLVVKQLPAQILDHQVMLPAPGQGALALEIHRSLSIEFRHHLARSRQPRCPCRIPCRAGFSGHPRGWLYGTGGCPCSCQSVRGTSLDLTLTAVIGRTLLSNLSEPTKAGPAVRLEVHGSTKDPQQFGANHAGEVLAKLRERNV